MISRSDIEALGFTYYRDTSSINNYTNFPNATKNASEYVGHTIWNGFRNVISLQHFDNDTIVIKALFNYLNEHWVDEALFTGVLTTKEELEDVLDNVLRIKINTIIFN